MKQPENLHAPISAPTVQEIVSDPEDLKCREGDPFFAFRNFYDDALKSTDDNKKLYPKLVATTEARALVDLTEKMTLVSDSLKSHSSYTGVAESAERFPAELRFIGQREFGSAVGGIALHWLEELQEKDELFIYTDSGNSQLFVYNSILDKVRETSEDAAQQITPFKCDSMRYRATNKLRSSRSKTILVDDWAVSGATMKTLADSARQFSKPKNMEVNLICSTDKHTRDGFEGIDVLSYFTRPYSNPQKSYSVSITGNHSHVDYGFHDTLTNFYSDLLQLDPAVRPPHPLLKNVFKVYKALAPDHMNILDAPQYELLRTEQERHRHTAESIADLNQITPKSTIKTFKDKILAKLGLYD